MPSPLRVSLAAAAAQSRLAFLPFLPAGYPDRETFIATLKSIAPLADAIEIGFPFSDPIADGPTIQAAFAQTLRSGFRVEHAFDAVRDARSTVTTPLVAMVSHSIVFRYGTGRFLSDARASGFDAILVPDLPPPEAQGVCDQIRAAGLDTVLLVAPTTSADRRRRIANLCTGFIYHLSVTGITGERDALPADLAMNVAALKSVASVPVCVGFGISQPTHFAQLRGVADGAIVGSAIVKRMQSQTDRNPESVAQAVANYCRDLTCAD